MDAQHFKAPYLRRTDILRQADELRQRQLPQGTLPVLVLDLAEFDLGLELVPKTNLRRAGDIDALLLGDLKTIVVDRDAFMDPRAKNRLRFSVAHEIGHLVLHRDIFAGLRHATAAEWSDYISAIPEVEYGWVEWQAYEFAGRLLVPPEPLREAFQAAIQSAQAAGYADWLAADEAAVVPQSACAATVALAV